MSWICTTNSFPNSSLPDISVWSSSKEDETLNGIWKANSPETSAEKGIGVGFDWTVGKNAGFFVRQRFMKFEDRSFALDRYQGNETTVELKIFF